MPFTPFHMGLAFPVKTVTGSSFSLMLFGIAQCAMDLQPLIHLFRGEGIHHGISHSYLGATVIGVLAVVIGRPICRRLLRLWQPAPNEHFLLWLRGSGEISWKTAIISAFGGTYSHVFIDSMIYDDVLPWAPFSASNPLLHSMSSSAMHLLCVGSGLLGCLGLAVVYCLETRRK